MAVHTLHRSILSLKSWLFTPATKADRFGRAAEVHADALIIDLEDAVALSDKQKARTAGLQYLQQQAEGRLPCALRINAPVTRTGIEDLHSLLESSAAPDYIGLPKRDAPGFISMVRSLLDQAAKQTEIIALIESAKGVEALPDIVKSDVRPVALLFAAADLGFHGKAAIHPKQIPIINEVFVPSAEEVANARQILAVNQQGVGSVDHQMVDEAVARKARLTLERAATASATLVTR